MRRANRRDLNEPAIVDALERAGALVAYWGTDGAPDLVVFFRDELYLIEVKGPKGELTDRQLEFHRKGWTRAIDIVRTPEEALMAINAIRPADLERRPL